MNLGDFGIDTASLEATVTVRIDLRSLKGLIADYIRVRGQVTELQQRMSEMVIERQLITAWLREQEGPGCAGPNDLADLIEHGAHLKPSTASPSPP